MALAGSHVQGHTSGCSGIDCRSLCAYVEVGRHQYVYCVGACDHSPADMDGRSIARMDYCGCSGGAFLYGKVSQMEDDGKEGHL